MSVKINYCNRYSVNGSAVSDMGIGEKFGVVGTNAEYCKNLPIGTDVFLSDSNNRWFQILQITGPASLEEREVWALRGGKKWKHVYKMKPLTMITKMRPCLRHILRELTCTTEDYDNFLNPKIHHTMNFGRVIEEFVRFANYED